MEASVPSNSSVIPSAMDLLMVFPRLAQRAGLYLPEAVGDIADKVWSGGSTIAHATAGDLAANASSTNITSTMVEEAIAQSTTAGMQAAFQRAWIQGTTTDGASIFGMMMQTFGRIKNFGGIFSYLTSRWALATFTAAIILNRAQFYASSREHLRLNWYVRMGVYAVPIGTVLRQLVIVLEALRCQTSPDFALLRYGDPLKSLALDFGGDDDLLYKLSSSLLFWKDDAACCAARNMSIPALDGDTTQLRGSMSLLFVFFLTLCASQLFETLACALQGRQPVPETGMTIFEHSLAFAECEAMISSALGFGFFGLPKSNDAPTSGSSDTSGPMFTRSEILQRLNVPPEVLLVCLISCFSHLSSALLAVSGLREKVRLINTGVWACCYMSAFIWSFARIFMSPAETINDLGVLRFPTVCVVGFIPHLVTLVGIIACSLMYGMALVLTACNVPDEVAMGMSLRQRFGWAYSNLQANVQFSQASAIRIKMSEDFYTTLLKVGFSVLTAASEAVYLNEGSKIQVAQMTWLERKRIDEFVVRMDNHKRSIVPPELLGEEIAKGVDFIDNDNAAFSKSPYARERKSRPKGTEAERANASEIDSGLGIKQKRNRMQLTCDFVIGIFWLSVSLQAHLLLDTMRRLGVQRRPRWLLKAAGINDDQSKSGTLSPGSAADNLQFWMVGPGGDLGLPRDRNVDVEAEMRRKHQRTGTYSTEEALGDNVYSWWRSGGWFGDIDSSGDYRAAEDDDDTTSMISMSSNASVADDWSDVEEESGRRTPTQRDPYTDRSREFTPSTDGGLDVGLLSKLLNPQSTAEREEARLLSYSLQADRPMTRAQFRRTTDRQHTQLIRGSTAADVSIEDEERDLEQFILMQRLKGQKRATLATGSWENGGEGMGEGGPQCVISTGNLVFAHRLIKREAEPRPRHVTHTKVFASQLPRYSPPLYDSRLHLRAPTILAPSHTCRPLSPPHFMQPELPTASTPVTTPGAPPETTASSTQHGLPLHDTAGVSLHSLATERVEDGAGTPAEQLAADAAFAASLQEGERHARREERRLSPPSPAESVSPKPSTPLRTPRNRIEEYEQASTPPIAKKREGPAFEVIKKQRDPADNRSPIAELPNELLTHALAHLAPNDLAAVASVSRRFHELVTTPHAWRSAFARLFLGSDSIDALERDSDDESDVVVRSERRVFTRLTSLASWRSEYILRTRLLRSLERGKPVQTIASPHASRNGQSHTAQSAFRYGSHLTHPVNHLHATFGTSLNKRMPRFIHASDDVGTATSSDPYVGKIDAWGAGDPQMFLQFYERFPGDSQFGMGPGEIVGVPNVMDVSQPHGMIHGEGSPAGMVYYRSTEEKRGRFLPFSSSMSDPESGIPRISSSNEAICAVWIAKSTVIPTMTDGLIGMLSGSSLGVLTSYSVGVTTNANNREQQRFGRGEMTARWVLSPGVPIIAIAVDNEYSAQRQAQNRIWAVVLNALGEVFYLSKFPTRSEPDRGTRLDDESREKTAWLTGRTVYWDIIEPSRRTAKPDPYAQAGADGSYSPRSSWNGMCLSKDQLVAETREIADYATRKPKDFRKACIGWDMRRRLEVDFAGSNDTDTGENIVVVGCGIEDDHEAYLTRYTRCRVQENYTSTMSGIVTAGHNNTSVPSTSLFGGKDQVSSTPSAQQQSSSSPESSGNPVTPKTMLEEWRSSTLSFGRIKTCQVTASTIDCSTHAVQTQFEDPLLGFTGPSTASSPSFTPISSAGPDVKSTDVPGHRARLLAVGTHTGSVILWDMRAPVSKRTDIVNSIDPVRIIYTQSPQISSLALTSLCLVHGGSDGLVQAWDPLASRTTPVRTLNSKFASRYHRQAMQAQPLPAGVQGVNYYAAAAICLDPDPTVLRGMVSLGTVLLYWYYSSSAADQYKSSKRRLRRAERGSNNGGEKFSGATRVNLNNYIANEQMEMEREKVNRKKESERFAGRFGTALLDGSEEEMIAYAAMLSQESHELEQSRRASDSASATDSAPIATGGGNHVWSSNAATPAQSASPTTMTPKTDDEYDADVAEAIRLSLAASQDAPTFDIPFRQAKPKGKRKGSSVFNSPKGSPVLAAGNSREAEMSDLDFAIQLSLAEEQSRADAGADSYGSPDRSSQGRKGKGRMM